jgi:TPR repeat protein
VQQNDAEGLEWLRKAAEGGGEDGEFGLGYLYYSGKVVPKDLTQAANWYRKAADQGNLDAQKALDELAKQGVTPTISTAPPMPATNSKPPADWVRFQQNAATWRALTQKPALPAAAVEQRTQAEAAYNAKDFHGAIAHYRQGLAMAPMWPEGWYNMGLLCGELNDYACAADGLKHYLELRPDASDAATVRRQMKSWQAKVAQ